MGRCFMWMLRGRCRSRHVGWFGSMLSFQADPNRRAVRQWGCAGTGSLAPRSVHDGDFRCGDDEHTAMTGCVRRILPREWRDRQVGIKRRSVHALVMPKSPTRLERPSISRLLEERPLATCALEGNPRALATVFRQW